MDFTHQGKAMVIGGSSGMGLATAKLLVKHNVEVIIVGRKAEKLEEALKQLNAIGKASAIQADLYKENLALKYRLLSSLFGGFGHQSGSRLRYYPVRSPTSGFLTRRNRN